MLLPKPGPFRPSPDRAAAYNRGAYLVTALAHCGECHTPRNALGAMRPSLWLAGTPDGPDGQIVPNITPDPATGIGEWQKADIVELLKTGTTPEHTTVKGAMREAIAGRPQDRRSMTISRRLPITCWHSRRSCTK